MAQGQVHAREDCVLLLEALLLRVGSLLTVLEVSVYLSHHL